MNIFEHEIGKSLRSIENRREDFYSFKMFDTTSFRLVSEKIFSLKVPCDFIAMFRGRTFFIECKSSKNKTSFPKKNIKEHQWTSMTNAEKAGAEAYFFINRRYKPREFACYVIKASTLSHLFSMFPKRASVRWEFIEEYSRSMNRITSEQSWELRPIFGLISMK